MVKKRAQIVRQSLINISLIFAICLPYSVTAESSSALVNELTPAESFLPTIAMHANWVFSGVVTNEHGENFNYLFQIQRDDADFHATVALFDAEKKQMIFHDESDAHLIKPNDYHWQIGHAFLSFNPINASWVLGCKNAAKQGFNFKVDMLKSTQHDPVVQDLSQGVEFVVSQTGQVNGHIAVQMHEIVQEQFVTAKTTWFRQIWLTDRNDLPPLKGTMPHSFDLLAKSIDLTNITTFDHKMGKRDSGHRLHGVLCQFNDGSGFYAMNMHETDALRGAIAGWYNEQGLPTTMSQFVKVQHNANGPWHIDVPKPQFHFVLTDFIQQNTIIAGFVAKHDQQGFCLLSQDVMVSSTLG